MAIVVKGPKARETGIIKDDGSGFRADSSNKTFLNKTLGPRTEEIIAKQNVTIREIRQTLREAERQYKATEKLYAEKEKAIRETRIRFKQNQRLMRFKVKMVPILKLNLNCRDCSNWETIEKQRKATNPG